MELQDELLPAHKRRVGRIGSLHEFQQRALSYQEGNSGPGGASPPPTVMNIFGLGGETDGAATTAVAGANDASAHAIDVRDLLRFSGRGSSGASPSVDTDSDYHLFEQFRKLALRSQRSRSVGSLFGGARYQSKSSYEFYGRQLKVLSFLVLLGVIGGPLGYGMRRYRLLLLLCKWLTKRWMLA